MALELDIKIETMFLLISGDWKAENRSEIIKKLDEIGVDGEVFYERNCRVIEKYSTAFNKRRVDSEGVQLLRKLDDEILLSIYVNIFIKHPDWFEKIDHISNEEIEKAVQESLEYVLEVKEDLILSLENLELSAELKWQIIVLKEQPKKQLSIVAGAVMDNLPACREAIKKVSSDLKELLAATILDDPEKNNLLRISYHIQPDAEIIPTLAFSLGVLILDDAVAYGLLVQKIMEDQFGINKEELLLGAKALSDKSKLEILLVLKDTPLYSTEIAERMDLTPATVSHHMNLLLCTGFVLPERRDGKIYYRISAKGFQRFIEGIAKQFLS